MFSILLTYILLVDYQSPYFLMIYSKLSSISDTKYELSGNSNLQFHGEDDGLNLLFFMTFLYFLIVYSRC